MSLVTPVPAELKQKLLSAFKDDAALKAALDSGDLTTIDDALGVLWTGPSTIESAVAVDEWTTFRDAARAAA